jgi:hypothetical protein
MAPQFGLGLPFPFPFTAPARYFYELAAPFTRSDMLSSSYAFGCHQVRLG